MNCFVCYMKTTFFRQINIGSDLRIPALIKYCPLLTKCIKHLIMDSIFETFIDVSEAFDKFTVFKLPLNYICGKQVNQLF